MGLIARHGIDHAGAPGGIHPIDVQDMVALIVPKPAPYADQVMRAELRLCHVMRQGHRADAEIALGARIKAENDQKKGRQHISHAVSLAPISPPRDRGSARIGGIGYDQAGIRKPAQVCTMRQMSDTGQDSHIRHLHLSGERLDARRRVDDILGPLHKSHGQVQLARCGPAEM